jgi:hypothetical protein
MAIERCQRAQEADNSKVNRQGKSYNLSLILPAHFAPGFGAVSCDRSGIILSGDFGLFFGRR